MSKPLGIIKDSNPIVTAPDVYALILNNTVVNTIIASYNDILSIYKGYDYCVDITMNGNNHAGVGYAYNGSNDSFIAPPPPVIDWVQRAEFDFDSVISAIQQIVIDCSSQVGNLTVQQINAAYNSALNDNPGLDPLTLTLIQSVLQYVLSGG